MGVGYATDPSTERDFTNFGRFMGHALIERHIGDGRFEFWIRQGAAVRIGRITARKLAI